MAHNSRLLNKARSPPDGTASEGMKQKQMMVTLSVLALCFEVMVQGRQGP